MEVRDVNTLLLLIHVTQGDLSQLGRVVMQGGFSVWISHKRAAVRMKELARFKPMQRHLFLYEHALLFCKRRDEDTPDRTPFYSFKSCLRVTPCFSLPSSTTDPSSVFCFLKVPYSTHLQIFILSGGAASHD